MVLARGSGRLRIARDGEPDRRRRARPARREPAATAVDGRKRGSLPPAVPDRVSAAAAEPHATDADVLLRDRSPDRAAGREAEERSSSTPGAAPDTRAARARDGGQRPAPGAASRGRPTGRRGARRDPRASAVALRDAAGAAGIEWPGLHPPRRPQVRRPAGRRPGQRQDQRDAAHVPLRHQGRATRPRSSSIPSQSSRDCAWR